MVNKEELQKKYVHFQFLATQAQEMREQLAILESKLLELRRLAMTLEEFPKHNKDAETWSNLGLGTYVKSKLANTKEVLVNIGAGVFMRKNIPSAISTIKTQISTSENYLNQLTSNLQTISIQAQALQGELS